MSVGDISSNKRGTGARFNTGKPDYSLMFLEGLLVDEKLHYTPEECLQASVRLLSKFQKHGIEQDLFDSYQFMCNYAMAQNSEEFYMDAVIRVWEYGKEKYAAWNWAKGMAWSVPIACFARHYILMNHQSEYLDDESGFPHWAHCLCNLQMLMRYYSHYPEGNDLPHNVLDMGEPKLAAHLQGIR